MLDESPTRKGRWSPERVEEALMLKAEGLSAGQIAFRMGVSRNAVLGQVWRASHPKETRQKPKPRVLPEVRVVNGERDVWGAWGHGGEVLRRAIWAKARRGARRTLAAITGGGNA